MQPLKRDFVRAEPTGADAPWQPHPRFAGVAMRTLIRGDDTGGGFSQHQVRIEPGCAIGDHVHPDHWESHAVLGGHGTATVAGVAMAYAPEVCAVMPKGVVHGVGAEAETVYILATFVPALE